MSYMGVQIFKRYKRLRCVSTKCRTIWEHFTLLACSSIRTFVKCNNERGRKRNIINYIRLKRDRMCSLEM